MRRSVAVLMGGRSREHDVSLASAAAVMAALDPERFDITRESAGQLAFGHGEHACVGMGLARLEGAAVLTALVERVRTIELGEREGADDDEFRYFADDCLIGRVVLDAGFLECRYDLVSLQLEPGADFGWQHAHVGHE